MDGLIILFNICHTFITVKETRPFCKGLLYKNCTPQNHTPYGRVNHSPYYSSYHLLMFKINLPVVNPPNSIKGKPRIQIDRASHTLKDVTQSFWDLKNSHYWMQGISAITELYPNSLFRSVVLSFCRQFSPLPFIIGIWSFYAIFGKSYYSDI